MNHISPRQAFVERAVVAVIVGSLSYLAAVLLFGAAESAPDVATLNAGLAYYTHEATGQIPATLASAAGIVTFKQLKHTSRYHHLRHGVSRAPIPVQDYEER